MCCAWTAMMKTTNCVNLSWESRWSELCATPRSHQWGRQTSIESWWHMSDRTALSVHTRRAQSMPTRTSHQTKLYSTSRPAMTQSVIGGTSMTPLNTRSYTRSTRWSRLKGSICARRRLTSQQYACRLVKCARAHLWCWALCSRSICHQGCWEQSANLGIGEYCWICGANIFCHLSFATQMTITRASFTHRKSQLPKFAQSMTPSYMQTVRRGPRRQWLWNVCSNQSVARMTCRTMSGGPGSGAGSRASLMKVKIGGSRQRGGRMSTTKESDPWLAFCVARWRGLV